MVDTVACALPIGKCVTNQSKHLLSMSAKAYHMADLGVCVFVGSVVAR